MVEIQKTKIFFDGNILSRIVRKDWYHTKDREAVEKIWALGKIIKMYSLKTKEESLATGDVATKRELLKLFEHMVIIPIRPSLSYSIVNFHSGHSTQDVNRTKLRKIFNKKGRRAASTNDADLIFDAAESGCLFFLTLDRGILNTYKSKRVEIKPLIGGMEIVDPQTLWDELDSLQKTGKVA